MTLEKITSEFEGKNITTVTYNGRPCWIAAEVGRILGYARDGQRLVNNITDDWSDEFIKQHDYILLDGEELKEFKKGMEVNTESVSTYSRHLLLVYESGLHLCLTKTNKPIGRRLRRFLVDEVIPQLVRDGQYSPEREIVDNRISTKRYIDNSKTILREERLAAWQGYQMQKEKSQAIEKMLDKLRSLNCINDDTYAAYLVIAAEMHTDRDFSALKPKIEDDWLTPTQIAEQAGVSTQRVGMTITALNLRGDNPGLCRPIINKTAGHNKQVVSYLYSPKAVQMISAKSTQNDVAASGE